MSCSLNFARSLIAVSIRKGWSPAAGGTGCACSSSRLISNSCCRRFSAFFCRTCCLPQPLALVTVLVVVLQPLRLSGAPRILTSTLQDLWSMVIRRSSISSRRSSNCVSFQPAVNPDDILTRRRTSSSLGSD